MADKYISDLTATTSISATDVFELDNGTNSRKVTATNLAKGLAPLASRGALVKKSADQTAANYTTLTAISWDSEVRDTDSIHDNVTNNTRLTVPSGVTLVRLRAGVRIANHTASQWIFLGISKNGSLDYDGVPISLAQIGTVNPATNVSSAVLSVTAGDYFEAVFQVQADTSIDITATRSWFEMEIVG